MKIQLNKLFRLLFIWILPLIIITFGITINHVKTYDTNNNELTCNQNIVLENNWLYNETIDTRQYANSSNYKNTNIEWKYNFLEHDNYYACIIHDDDQGGDYFLYLFYQTNQYDYYANNWVYSYIDEAYDNLEDMRINLAGDNILTDEYPSYIDIIEYYNDGNERFMDRLGYNSLVYQGEYYTQPKNPIQRLNNIIFEQLGINTNSQITIFINYYITLVCINIIIYTIVLGLLGIILIIPKKMGKKDDDY